MRKIGKAKEINVQNGKYIRFCKCEQYYTPSIRNTAFSYEL